MIINPSKDESAYSILSRLHIVSGLTSPLDTFIKYIGVRGYKPQSGLPTHLSYFLNKIKYFESINFYINEHTHYPYYSHFIEEKRQKEVIEAMKSKGATKSRLGLLRSHVGAGENLRYCQHCVFEDIQRYGFAFWHRKHGLPGVLICHEHFDPLVEVKTRKKIFGERALLLPKGGKLVDFPSGINAYDSIESLVSLSCKLVNAKPLFTVNSSIYRELLSESGFISEGGSVKQHEVEKVVRAWLAPISKVGVYRKLHNSLSVERNWLAELTAGHYGFHHPLKHFILWNSFSWTFKDIEDINFKIGKQLNLNFSKSDRILPTDNELDIALHKYGSLRKASKALNCSVSTLSVMADKAGIKTNKRPKYITTDIRKIIIKEFMMGATSSELAYKYGLSIGSINRIRRAGNV